MIAIVGCEESQAITLELRKIGIEAYSCDLLPCSGGHPELHLQMDVFKAIAKLKPEFGIFHPPCTYVAGSSVQWLSHPDDKHLPFEDRRPHPKYPDRRRDMEQSVEFVKALYNALPVCGIENPVGLLSSLWKKPDQIVQPYHFGDEATKTTCFWVKGLPLLNPTNIVGKGERENILVVVNHILNGTPKPAAFQKLKDKIFAVKLFLGWLKLLLNSGVVIC